jgi:hypothetical protein
VKKYHDAATARWSEPREPRASAPADPWGGRAPDVPTGTRLRSDITQLEVRLDELATTFIAGLERVEKRLAGIEGQLDAALDARPQARRGPDDDARFEATALAWSERGPSAGGPVVSQPIAPYGAASLRGGPGDAAGERVPVEIRDGEVVASHSLPPEAWLVPQGGGRAALSVNDEVPLTGFALDRFALYFDLGERREGHYLTRLPAEVKWDGRRGTAGRPGKAVPR